MIKSITVTNHLNESIKLYLTRPDYYPGFVIQSIKGLGPEKATINTTDFSTTDGSLFNSARLLSRNIVMGLKFLPNPTIEHTRQLSYRYFPIKKKVTLLIETDNRKLMIDGYIESNEPNIFSKDEGTDISIICPDPYFYSPEKNITSFYGVESLFEFPFASDDSSLIFGDSYSYSERTINYDGTSEIGVIIKIKALKNRQENLSIRNNNNLGSTYVTISNSRLIKYTGSGIIEGDEITISTIKGNKYINLKRGGTTTNILNCLFTIRWIQLSYGENNFRFYNNVNEVEDNLDITIENQIIYEGV